MGDHELRVEPEIPEWLQPFTEGSTRRSSSSTAVSPADAATPPPALPPSAHPPQHVLQTKQETHFPKHPKCEVCRRTKVTRAPCKDNSDDRWDRILIAENFGDTITADYKVLNENQESILHHKYAVVVQDLATQWIQSYPGKTK